METLEVLKQIIVEKFEKDRDSITLDSTLETLEIDSLDIFDIVFDAEEIFGISVPNDQVTVSTIGDVVKLIDRLRAAKE